LGRPLVIPIVLRTLAGTIPFIAGKNVPFVTDQDFLATIDTGEQHLVSEYELRWWAGRKPRDLNTVEILNASTLEKCLNHYKEQSHIAFPAGAGAGIHARDRSGKTGNAGSGSTTNKKANIYPLSAGADASDGCHYCPKYRQLLSDVLQDVLKFQNYASVMSTSSENLLNIGIRRASTFNLLHEAAILKESGSIPPPAKTPTAHRIADVVRKASAELDRLKDLPASSYKWTWGETLTEKDVINLRRPGTKPGRAHHSGYDISLVHGKVEGEYSSGPSAILSSIGQMDELPDEASLLIPPTELHFPKYFSTPDHRDIYAPFDISSSTPDGPLNSVPDSPDKDSMPVAGSSPLKDMPRKSHADDVLDVADLWDNGKESPEPENESMPVAGSPPLKDMPRKSHADDVLDVADLWDNGKESPEPDNESMPVAGSPPLKDVPRKSHADDVLDVADLWDNSNEAPEQEPFDGAGLPENESMPVVGSPPVPRKSDADDVLDVADLWDNANESPEPEQLNMLSVSLTNRIDDTDPSAIAGLWTDSEHSGDELASPSYDPLSAEEGNGRDFSEDALDIAEHWSVSEDLGIAVAQPAPTEEWSYGPEHFSFLDEEMFEIDEVQ
jgi:hypothetical protein